MPKAKQALANEKWESNNREYSSYLKSRSSARSFIRNKATADDLKEFVELIEERKINIGKDK